MDYHLSGVPFYSLCFDDPFSDSYCSIFRQRRRWSSISSGNASPADQPIPNMVLRRIFRKFVKSLNLPLRYRNEHNNSFYDSFKPEWCDSFFENWIGMVFCRRGDQEGRRVNERGGGVRGEGEHWVKMTISLRRLFYLTCCHIVFSKIQLFGNVRCLVVALGNAARDDDHGCCCLIMKRTPRSLGQFNNDDDKTYEAIQA